MLRKILNIFKGEKSSLDELIRAVDDELEWTVKRGSGKRIRINNGEKKVVAGGRVYYVFKLDEDLRLADDTPIELLFENTRVRGTIASITPTTIVLALEQDIGDRIESATLVSQAAFILQALRKNLAGKSGNRTLAEEVLAGRIQSVKTQESKPAPVKQNQFQENAVRTAMGRTVTYVWGPPGTGKTWTIALLSYSLYNAGDRILVLSNTNAAVDNALRMIAQVIPNASIIRIGNSSANSEISNIRNPDTDEQIDSPNDWRVVGTTFAKSYVDSRFSMLRFDTVIIDEASMAQLPSIYHSAMLARQRAIVVGDFEQLPPIAMNHESAAVKQWMMHDVFEHIGIAADPKSYVEQGKLMMLRKQYRMDTQISGLINELIYSGLLEDGITDKHIAIDPAPETSLVLADTSSLNPWCHKSATSSSKYNLYHAFLAVAIAERVLAQGKKPVIITPYADQALRIRYVLRDKGLEEQISASTVHRYQGQEAEVVIYDITDSEGTTPHWLESDVSKRLMNVAFSRAKNKLIVIANKRFLNSRLPDDNIARKALQHIERNGKIVNARNFLPKDFQIKDPTAKTLDHDEYDILRETQIATFTEETFYPAFTTDLQNATKEIRIFSPFITQKRLGRLAEDLKTATTRGVKVTVYTRPPQYMFDTKGNADSELVKGASESINYLKRIKINVETRPQMHEKLAVIDLKTWYIGSLNILSHASTHETMIRFQGLEKTIQNLVDEILKQQTRREIHTEKINQLREGSKGVRVEGVITMKSATRRVAEGKKVANAMVTDGTGAITLVLWDDQIKPIQEGMKIRVENGYVTSFRGNLQLNAGRYGKVVPLSVRDQLGD